MLRDKNPCPWCRDIWHRRSLFEWFVLRRQKLGAAQVAKGGGCKTVSLGVRLFQKKKVHQWAELCISSPNSACSSNNVICQLYANVELTKVR